MEHRWGAADGKIGKPASEVAGCRSSRAAEQGFEASEALRDLADVLVHYPGWEFVGEALLHPNPCTC
jgi:hypothetical protein